MTPADVVVIGAGIMGVSTAYHLARRRAGRIVVLER
ncbi:MAG TPA: FAD-dependent oxidoreductase, partial [Methylomirabilota bacterium]|nr:FAD-dependent oxidoreductase [Methylomirabilota bacterium]